METLALITGTIVVVGIIGFLLYLMLRTIHNAIRHSGEREGELAVAEYHALRADASVETFFPDEDVPEIVAEVIEEKPQERTLEEWLAFNERDWLRKKRHELVDTIAKQHKDWRNLLYAIPEELSEFTMEWSKEWEEGLKNLLATNGTRV